VPGGLGVGGRYKPKEENTEKQDGFHTVDHSATGYRRLAACRSKMTVDRSALVFCGLGAMVGRRLGASPTGDEK
jgi:hypothetical protein